MFSLAQSPSLNRARFGRSCANPGLGLPLLLPPLRRSLMGYIMSVLNEVGRWDCSPLMECVLTMSFIVCRCWNASLRSSSDNVLLSTGDVFGPILHYLSSVVLYSPVFYKLHIMRSKLTCLELLTTHRRFSSAAATHSSYSSHFEFIMYRSIYV